MSILDHAFARAIRCFACSFLMLTAPPTFGATAVYSVLLDTDANSATGCPVTTIKGMVQGVEQVLSTTVVTTPTNATVTGVTRSVCSAGSFGAPITVDSTTWPVGLGNGMSGFAVIETYLALASLGATSNVRAYVVS